MKRLLFLIFLLIASRASALIDFNQNGISDPAERHLNQGQLLAAGTDVHAKLAGGWSLSEIATAGLSPDDATQGILRIEGSYIPPVFHQDSGGNQQILTPAAYTLTFATVYGKSYTIEASPDLGAGSWIIVDQFTGEGSTVTQTIALTQPDGSIPPKLFFKVQIKDIDSDFDGLLDVEEIELGTSRYTAWTDADGLTDYDEVTLYHTDPTNPMTNGIDLDHIALGIDGPGENEIVSSYAPEVHLFSIQRVISYSFTPHGDDAYGSLNGGGMWKDSSYTSGLRLTEPIPFSQLPGRLASLAPYPKSPPILNDTSDSFSTYGNSVLEPPALDGSPGNEYASYTQTQAWLRLSTPTQIPITCQAMYVTYTSPPEIRSQASPTPVFVDVKPISFDVPAGSIASKPQEFGNDGADLIRWAALVKFIKPGDSDLGWDDTGNTPWQSLKVGETTDGVLHIASSVPEEVMDLLEIAPAAGSGSYLQITGQAYDGVNMTFKMIGSSESSDTDVSVVLRHKGEPTVIFAKLNVRVFKPREVKVSIFRIWDSRLTDASGYNPTKVISAPNDSVIINKLNESYTIQTGIKFVVDRDNSRTLDIRYTPGKPVGSPEEPLRFTESGGLGDDAAILGIDGLIKKFHGLADQRLSIHIIQNYTRINPNSGSLEGGTTWPEKKTCFISAEAGMITYPHEVGHCLGISTRGKGMNEKHDLGPWPANWASTGQTGLMYPQDRDEIIPWIRQEDWKEAVRQAKFLK